MTIGNHHNVGNHHSVGNHHGARPMQLTPHFTLWELSQSEYATRRGINNDATVLAKQNLLRLCIHVLEPVRELLGVPLHINSGYRNELVNSAIGGSKKSAHVEGRAADFVPVGMDLQVAFDRIRDSSIMFDQVILECDAWLHIAVAPERSVPRLQALLASGGPGTWSYVKANSGVVR